MSEDERRETLLSEYRASLAKYQSLKDKLRNAKEVLVIDREMYLRACAIADIKESQEKKQ